MQGYWICTLNVKRWSSDEFNLGCLVAHASVAAHTLKVREGYTETSVYNTHIRKAVIDEMHEVVFR